MEVQSHHPKRTAPEEQLRTTIENVRSALGQLPNAYDERAAIRLIMALGDCDAFVAPALNYLHSPEQESARRDYHELCGSLERAIRRAVAQPSRIEHEREVVRLSRELAGAADAVQSAFGWNDEGQTCPGARH